MEDILVFVYNGFILIIEKDEGESSVHFSERLEFIFDRYEYYYQNTIVNGRINKNIVKNNQDMLDVLKTYSRILIAKAFLSSKYPRHVEETFKLLFDKAPFDDIIMNENKQNTQNEHYHKNNIGNFLIGSTIRKIKVKLSLISFTTQNKSKLKLYALPFRKNILQDNDSLGYFYITDESDKDIDLTDSDETDKLIGAKVIEIALSPLDDTSKYIGLDLTVVSKSKTYRINICNDQNCDKPGTTLIKLGGQDILIEPKEFKPILHSESKGSSETIKSKSSDKSAESVDPIIKVDVKLDSDNESANERDNESEVKSDSDNESDNEQEVKPDVDNKSNVDNESDNKRDVDNESQNSQCDYFSNVKHKSSIINDQRTEIINDMISKKYINSDNFISINDEILKHLFDEYDTFFCEDKLATLAEGIRVDFNIKLDEMDDGILGKLGKLVIDTERHITFNMNKNGFLTLDNTHQHIINGIKCNTRALCFVVIFEELLIDFIINLCPTVERKILAKHLFGHTSLEKDIKFGSGKNSSIPKVVPNINILSKPNDATIKERIYINDRIKYEGMSLEVDKVKEKHSTYIITDSNVNVPYSDITEINGEFL